MIDPEASNRPTIKEIKASDWYQGETYSDEDMRMRMVANKGHKTHKSDRDVVTKSSSEQVHLKSVKLKKQTKKHTPFYTIEDGDELVDIVVKFARRNTVLIMNKNPMSSTKLS
jgi:hypothetical protein